MSENATATDIFEPSTQKHETYDTGDPESLVTTVVEALAAATGDDPTAMPPLYETVDPDALVQLFQSNTAGRDGPLRVTFQANGRTVIVTGQGDVFVRQ
jgi:hypothetical protein